MSQNLDPLNPWLSIIPRIVSPWDNHSLQALNNAGDETSKKYLAELEGELDSGPVESYLTKQPLVKSKVWRMMNVTLYLLMHKNCYLWISSPCFEYPLNALPSCPYLPLCTSDTLFLQLIASVQLIPSMHDVIARCSLTLILVHTTEARCQLQRHNTSNNNNSSSNKVKASMQIKGNNNLNQR